MDLLYYPLARLTSLWPTSISSEMGKIGEKEKTEKKIKNEKSENPSILSISSTLKSHCVTLCHCLLKLTCSHSSFVS